VSLAHELPNQVGAEKSGAAGYERLHVLPP
jgi:hypothetical protein